MFEAYDEPNGAEIGDWWLDLDGNLQGNEPIDDDWTERTISWANVTGKPTTLAGYGITDPIASANHTHTTNQVSGLATQLSNLLTSLNSLDQRTTANANDIATNRSNITANSTAIS